MNNASDTFIAFLIFTPVVVVWWWFAIGVLVKITQWIQKRPERW